MAENTGRRRTAPAATETEEDRKPTKRTVLRRARTVVVPQELLEDASLDTTKKIAQALGVAQSKVAVAETWVPVGEFEGSKNGAIAAYAGEPNTPEAKPGAYKAVPARSWAGGRLYEKPPEPKVEVRELD